MGLAIENRGRGPKVVVPGTGQFLNRQETKGGCGRRGF